MKIERIIQIEKFLTPSNFGVYKLEESMETANMEIPQDHFLLFNFEKELFTHCREIKQNGEAHWKMFSMNEFKQYDPDFSVVAVKAV